MLCVSFLFYLASVILVLQLQQSVAEATFCYNYGLVFHFFVFKDSNVEVFVSVPMVLLFHYLCSVQFSFVSLAGLFVDSYPVVSIAIHYPHLSLVSLLLSCVFLHQLSG